MSLLPSPEPTVWQKQWRIIAAGLATILFFAFLLFLGWQARARAESLETLARAQEIRNALALYFYRRNEYPPVGGSAERVDLGGAGAICLDRSDEGLRGACERNTVIAPRLPADFIYTKIQTDEYRVAFRMKKSVDGLGDTDGNGILECEANTIGIRCR